MTDFLDRLEGELTVAAVRNSRRSLRISGRAFRRRPALALATVAALLVAVPALAAVTRALRTNAHPAPAHPGLVDVGPPCVSHTQPKLDRTSAPPPAELTALLGVLRRAQQPADQLPDLPMAMLPVQGVNPAYVRQVIKGARQVYMVPAQNVRHLREPGCGGPKPPQPKPQAGVCLLVHLPSGGGAGCEPVSAIRSGAPAMTFGGATRTLALGVARDGIDKVIWRVRERGRFHDIQIAVVNNVWMGEVPKGRGAWVYVVSGHKRTLVQAPQRLTHRQRLLRAEEKRRDANAAATPTVFPGTGGARTIFTLRMRLRNPSARFIYVATIRSTACPSKKPYSIGMTPALRGADVGLLKAGFSAYSAGAGKWCRGTYQGVVTERPRRRPVTGRGPTVGHFTFRVR